jgi:hypothetical protein
MVAVKIVQEKKKKIWGAAEKTISFTNMDIDFFFKGYNKGT